MLSLQRYYCQTNCCMVAGIPFYRTKLRPNSNGVRNGCATKCQFELFTYKTMYLLDVNLIQLV